MLIKSDYRAITLLTTGHSCRIVHSRRLYFWKEFSTKISNAVLKAFVFESKNKRIENTVGKVETIQKVKQRRIHPVVRYYPQCSEAHEYVSWHNAHQERDEKQSESFKHVDAGTAKHR